MTPRSETARLATEISRLFSLLARARMRATGTEGVALTATQWLVLGAVVEEGPHRLGALAEWAGTTDATASRAVEALVGAGGGERVVQLSRGGGADDPVRVEAVGGLELDHRGLCCRTEVSVRLADAEVE